MTNAPMLAGTGARKSENTSFYRADRALPFSRFPFPTQPGGLADLLNRLPREIRCSAYPGPVYLRQIEPGLCGSFVVTDGGEPNAITFPARDGGDGTKLIDEVAVTADGRVMTLRGDAVLLGHQHFDEADFHGSCLHLHPDPICWLASGGKGVAVLDWFVAAPLIAHLPELLLHDADHADAVWRRIRMYGTPKMYLLKECAA